MVNGKPKGRRPARPQRARRQTAAGAARLGRESWIAGGRAMLIAGGIAAVRIEPLATALAVTTGSFYWHFKDRDALLAAMLDDWEQNNTLGMTAALAAHPDDPLRAFAAMTDVWIDEKVYSPAWDTAVRDWARISTLAEQSVRRVDDRRIGMLHTLFRQLGYAEPEAFVRARVAYFHQIGYYALQIVESRRTRKRLEPIYNRILLGKGGKHK
jgi:AcrR family transcriptional regulator